MKWWRTFGSVASALSNDPASSPLGRTAKVVRARGTIRGTQQDDVLDARLRSRSGSDDLTGARGGRENQKFDIKPDLQCLSHGCEQAYRRVATPGLQRSDNWLRHFHPLRQLQLGQPELFSSAPDALTDELCMNRRPAGAGHPFSDPGAPGLHGHLRLQPRPKARRPLSPRRPRLPLRCDRRSASSEPIFLAIGVEIYEIAVALTEDGYPNLDELLAAFDELEVLSPLLESGRESINELSVWPDLTCVDADLDQDAVSFRGEV